MRKLSPVVGVLGSIVNGIRNQFPMSNGAPKIVLYALNFHENLIEEEGITVTLMPAAKSLGVLRDEFDTPQSNLAIYFRQLTE